MRFGLNDRRSPFPRDRCPMTRPSAQRRGYDAKWQKARARHLKANPLCVYCLQSGKRQLGSYVDHIVPHKGDRALFWNTANWQTLCFHHKTVRQKDRK